MFELSSTTPPLIRQRGTALPPALRQDSIHGVWPPFVGRFPVAGFLVLERPLPASNTDWLHYFAAMQAAQDSSPLNTDGLELSVDYQAFL